MTRRKLQDVPLNGEERVIKGRQSSNRKALIQALRTTKVPKCNKTYFHDGTGGRSYCAVGVLIFLMAPEDGVDVSDQFATSTNAQNILGLDNNELTALFHISDSAPDFHPAAYFLEYVDNKQPDNIVR